MIKLKAKSFIVHKKSETFDDCQDAWAAICILGQEHEQNIERYAVADGATRSFYPKQWAELLVKNYCEATGSTLAEGNLEEWICPIQKEWYEQIEKRVNEQNKYFLTNRFNKGESAVSTFIGLEIDKSNEEWKALIIGDSCLFHKSDAEFKSYLIENSADFTNRPDAFASFPKDDPIGCPKFIDNKMKPGDTFILATDALAKWIVQHKEKGKIEEALTQLNALETDEQFYQFVDEARQNTEISLDNDDVTLMLISVEMLPSQETIELESPSHAEIQDALQQESSFSFNLGRAMLFIIPGLVILFFICWVFQFITNR